MLAGIIGGAQVKRGGHNYCRSLFEGAACISPKRILSERAPPPAGGSVATHCQVWLHATDSADGSQQATCLLLVDGCCDTHTHTTTYRNHAIMLTRWTLLCAYTYIQRTCVP